MAGLNDGKLACTITNAQVDRGYCHATTPGGERVFIFANACETYGRWAFEDLRFGSQVRLIPIEGPKGLRGVDVEIVAI